MNEPEFRVGDDGEIEYEESNFEDEKPKRKSKQEPFIEKKVTLRIPLFFVVSLLLIALAAGGILILQTSSTASVVSSPSLDSAPFCSDKPLLTDDRIVFSVRASTDAELFLSDPMGEHACRLTRNAFIDGTPLWSPDGTQIAFDSVREGRVDIFMMNADGTNVRNLTKSCKGGSAVTDWSPDGKQLLLTSGCSGESESELYLMNADGSNIRSLTQTPGGHSQLGRWSPDGLFIAFASTGNVGGSKPENSEIYLIRTDGSYSRRITSNRVFDSFPEWSPNGSQLLFRSDEVLNQPKLKWLYTPIRKADPISIHDFAFDLPLPSYSRGVKWLPDRQYLAFISAVEGYNTIYRYDTWNSQGTPQRILPFKDITDFDWWQRSQ